jgi:tryptophanyl-tRNA synthetase
MMLTDDMKLLHSPSLTASAVATYSSQNAKDILAFTFNPARTFLFSNLNFVGGAFYQNIINIARHITVTDIKKELGFEDNHNVGMFYCCSTQSAGAVGSSFPGILGAEIETLESDPLRSSKISDTRNYNDTKSINYGDDQVSRPQNKPQHLNDMPALIPCSYDIDGYFASIRKHASNLGYHSPSFLYSALLPSLQGDTVKMSASLVDTAVFLTDTPPVIQDKISSVSDPDVCFAYLTAFMEDDEQLGFLRSDFEGKRVGLADVKRVLVQVLTSYVKAFGDRRELISDEVLQTFMTRKRINDLI